MSRPLLPQDEIDRLREATDWWLDIHDGEKPPSSEVMSGWMHWSTADARNFAAYERICETADQVDATRAKPANAIEAVQTAKQPAVVRPALVAMVQSWRLRVAAGIAVFGASIGLLMLSQDVYRTMPTARGRAWPSR